MNSFQVSAEANSQINTLAEKGYNMILSHQISNPGDRFCKGYEGNTTGCPEVHRNFDTPLISGMG